uniref:Uncharacterized conserved protein n=1 Tax=uncultured bacterium contig00085 TaxID=1181558 RepID=A0A806KP20_9BACT|nr:uncharacterized conserved protein [uncultured bacterium contig00085]
MCSIANIENLATINAEGATEWNNKGLTARSGFQGFLIFYFTQMKHFTQISKFAAMAAIAAIGISLYACEEKEKASKPTEAAVQQETQKPVSGNDTILNVGGVPIDLVFVQGGTFTMGCIDEQDDNCDPYTDEKPNHSVTLSSFYIGKYEVTQKLWKQVMGNNPSKFKGDNLPVDNVTLEAIQGFINKLNQQTGKKYYLPTEAEWEYAARGGNKSKGYKYSGSNNDSEVVASGDAKTIAVGTKKPNELGIYDMSGNVWEWVYMIDTWRGYVAEARTNPKGERGMLRGGDNGCYMWCWRVSTRYDYNTFEGDFIGTGFRLALPPE